MTIIHIVNIKETLRGLLLAKIVRERINDYWARYNNDEFKVYK